ncbi:hypothetical protein ES703_07867 [subsurface metagenome]
MNPRTKDTIIYSFASLVIVCVVVLLIVGIVIRTGHDDLLTQFFQNTAKGNIGGLSISVGGPFGMWVITYLVLQKYSRETPLGSIKLYLRFVNPTPALPTLPAHYLQAQCSYTIYSNGNEIESGKNANVQFQQTSPNVQMPYIYVNAPGVNDPEFQVTLEYQGNEWISDSYSPKTGRVDFH